MTEDYDDDEKWNYKPHYWRWFTSDEIERWMCRREKRGLWFWSI